VPTPGVSACYGTIGEYRSQGPTGRERDILGGECGSSGRRIVPKAALVVATQNLSSGAQSLPAMRGAKSEPRRNRLIRFTARGWRHRSDERTESQGRLRSCYTLVLAWKQTGVQLDVVQDLFADESAGSLSDQPFTRP
jgi:hypothetical protein